MNIRSMLTNVRIRCGDPLAQRPSDRTVLLLLSTQIQRFLNKTSLSGKPWAVDEMPLALGGNIEEIPIPADASFGKPLQVRTTDLSNPSHIERNVEFFELGDANFNWNLPGNIGSLDGSPNSAIRMAFYRKSGMNQVYARVLPTPQQTANYLILYQVGVFGEVISLDDTPLLPEHHALIEIRTAIAALPHCEWFDDKTDNANRRKELALALAVDSSDLERDFVRYISTTSASTSPTMQELPFSFD